MSSFESKSPIVIMTAMEMEADILLDKIKIEKTEKIWKYTFYEWSISKYPVVLCLCKVNTRNASVATYIAIDKYHPIAIINQGTAWWHWEKVHPGDIVIVKECFNSISWRSPIKAKWKWSNSLEWDFRSFTDDSWDTFQLINWDSELIKIAENLNNPYIYGKIYVWTLASGDFWNREYDKIIFLNTQYNSLWEDMECIAIYDIAHDFNVPVLWIKVISNNEILKEPFDKNMAKIWQEFTYEFLLSLIKRFQENKTH